MKAVLSLRLRMYLAVKRELQAIVNSVGTAGLPALLDVLTAKIEESRFPRRGGTEDRGDGSASRRAGHGVTA